MWFEPLNSTHEKISHIAVLGLTEARQSAPRQPILLVADYPASVTNRSLRAAAQANRMMQMAPAIRQ
jgi:hypothetical protein